MHDMGRTKKAAKDRTTSKGVRFQPDVFVKVKRLARKPRTFSPVVNALIREAFTARERADLMKNMMWGEWK